MSGLEALNNRRVQQDAHDAETAALQARITTLERELEKARAQSDEERRMRLHWAGKTGEEFSRAETAIEELTASQAEVERLKALVTDMTKAARTLELAETELCRAEATAEQPRLMNAGTRYYAAKQMVFSVAFRARAAIQLEESKP